MGIKINMADYAKRSIDLAAFVDDSHLRLMGEDGESARQYLSGHGINNDSMKEFRLGLCPPVEDGEATNGEMIVVPQFDDTGKATTAHFFPASAQSDCSKALVVPGVGSVATPYGFDRALPICAREGIVIVESVFDALVGQCNGDPRMIAIDGPLQGIQSQMLLAAHAKRVYLAEAAGNASIAPKLKPLTDAGIDTMVLRLPAGDTPGQFIVKNGIVAWRKLVSEAVPSLDWTLEQAIGGFESMTESEKRDALAAALEATAGAIRPNAPVDEQRGIEQISRITDIRVAVLKKQLKEVKRGRRDSMTEENPAGSQYESTDQGLIRRYWRDGERVELLTNFKATIVEDISHFDGTDTERILVIQANVNGKIVEVRVKAEEFDRMEWVVPLLGPEAIVFPNNKEHARAAIQKLSGEVPTRIVYGHTGWATINGEAVYLHAGGGIGPNGPVPGVEVGLGGSLDRYLLPEPPQGPGLIAAIRAALTFLALAPLRITVPILAATFRAVVGSADFVIFLVGRTGAFKSELSAGAQQFFGPGMDSRHLPEAWSSTAKALIAVAYAIMHALLTIDDFKPEGTLQQINEMQGKVNAVIRGAGNNAGRSTLTRESRLRASKPPRGLILGSGEDVPREESVKARMLLIEVAPSSVNTTRLTEFQKVARAGLPAMCMAGYLRWMSSRRDAIIKRMPEEIAMLREKASACGAHRRTPEIIANLYFGLDQFVAFAVDVEAIDREYADGLLAQSWDALIEIGNEQADAQAQSNPAFAFLACINSALNSGRAHLVDGNTGGMPNCAPSLGWKESSFGGKSAWRGSGESIGVVDGDDVYLDPTASFAVAQKLATETNSPFAVQKGRLTKHLVEAGLLLSVTRKDKKGGAGAAVRKQFNGTRQAWLHMRLSSVIDDFSQD